MSSGDPLTIGVLGAADIARRRTVPAIVASGRFRLVAVASRTADRAAAFAAEFGCEAVTGYARLLERDDVQAVYVPLPNALHEHWTAEALAAGKHVLVEKSFTARAASAAALAGTAAARGLVLMENFAFVHHAQHARVRELVGQGAIGTPRAVAASFGIPRADRSLIRYRPDLDGGALLEVGTYTVRAARLFLGADAEVAGARLLRDPETGVDIAGSALLADGRGLTAQCDFGLDHSYRCSYAVWGSEGCVSLDWAFTPPPGERPRLWLERGREREERLLPADDQFLRMVTAFADACADPAGHSGLGADAVAQARLLEDIRRRASGPREPNGEL